MSTHHHGQDLPAGGAMTLAGPEEERGRQTPRLSRPGSTTAPCWGCRAPSPGPLWGQGLPWWSSPGTQLRGAIPRWPVGSAGFGCRDGWGVHPACSLRQRGPEDPRPDPTRPDLMGHLPGAWQGREQEGGVRAWGFRGLWFPEDVLRPAQSLRRARLCMTPQAPLSTRLSRQDPGEGPHVELNFHVDEFSL